MSDESTEERLKQEFAANARREKIRTTIMVWGFIALVIGGLVYIALFGTAQSRCEKRGRAYYSEIGSLARIDDAAIRDRCQRNSDAF